MPLLAFTAALQRHVGPLDPLQVPAGSLEHVLDAAFQTRPELRGYVLDDQGRIRRHIAVFVDGTLVADRGDLGLQVGQDSRIDVLQALSGG